MHTKGTFLDLGWSLTCGICRKKEEDCVGESKVCYPYLDQCGTFQSKNHKSRRAMTRKACVQANSCFEKITSVDLGENGIISSKLTCLPPANTTLNGKKCKTCFSRDFTFCMWEEIVSCKGDQTYCLEMDGLADWGGYGTLETHGRRSFMINFAMKGCVNPAFCELFHEGSVYFATLFLMGGGSCKPATAKATKVPPHRVGFFFQVFAGFLIVEIYA
ncbi:hypothetical protein E2320_000659 [Naja naja]|nr:hypothetical protein E2320_000659 [Naja naja]